MIGIIQHIVDCVSTDGNSPMGAPMACAGDSIELTTFLGNRDQYRTLPVKLADCYDFGEKRRQTNTVSCTSHWSTLRGIFICGYAINDVLNNAHHRCGIATSGKQHGT